MTLVLKNCDAFLSVWQTDLSKFALTSPYTLHIATSLFHQPTPKIQVRTTCFCFPTLQPLQEDLHTNDEQLLHPGPYELRNKISGFNSLENELSTFCQENEWNILQRLDSDKDDGTVDGTFEDAAGIKSRRKAVIMNLLLQGKNPLEILDLLQTLSSAEYWTIIEYLAAENRIGEALQAFAHWRQMKDYKPPEKYFAKFMRILGAAKRPDISQLLFNEMISMGLQPSLLSYTALIDCYAEAGCLDYAEELVRKMRKDCIIFNAAALNSLMLAYSKLGKLDHMNRLFNNMKRWGCSPDYRTFRWVIVAYAKAGLFRRMELLWREMDNNGWKLDSIMISAIIQSYAANGLVKDMHDSYLRIKEYRLLVNKPTIRAMASAYIRISKFYQVRLLVKDLDLMRKDTGTLLWNLLLLAFAANFQVKNVQRTMLGMEKVGQTCDLTTYNICALCYARMKMFWELHAVLVRMRRAGITPDLVTFGAVVDCYISGRERFQKMFKELDELGLKECCPEVGTDPLVFEAFGKGDFQTSSETLMQANPQPYGRRWTYGLLLSFYLKKRGATRNSQNSAGNQGSRFVAKMFVPY